MLEEMWEPLVTPPQTFKMTRKFQFYEEYLVIILRLKMFGITAEEWISIIRRLRHKYYVKPILRLRNMLKRSNIKEDWNSLMQDPC